MTRFILVLGMFLLAGTAHAEQVLKGMAKREARLEKQLTKAHEKEKITDEQYNALKTKVDALKAAIGAARAPGAPAPTKEQRTAMRAQLKEIKMSLAEAVHSNKQAETAPNAAAADNKVVKPRQRHKDGKEAQAGGGGNGAGTAR